MCHNQTTFVRLKLLVATINAKHPAVYFDHEPHRDGAAENRFLMGRYFATVTRLWPIICFLQQLHVQVVGHVYGVNLLIRPQLVLPKVRLSMPSISLIIF